MTKFLNKFSLKAKSFPEENINYLEKIFLTFIGKVSTENKTFHSKTGKFNISVFESIFVFACSSAFDAKTLDILHIDLNKVSLLKEDSGFIEATQSDTASEKNVSYRITKAKEILS